MSKGKVIQSLYVEGKTDYINGYVIADGGDYDFDESETGDISALIKEIAQLLQVDEKEIKLITGTRPC